MKKFLCALLLLACLSSESANAANSSDAFMSLKFGLKYERVQKRMEKSGAVSTIPRKETLTMEGMFEGYPAMFVFGFYKNKILKSKAVYLLSLGDSNKDANFYAALQKTYNAFYGSGHETPTASTRDKRKLILRNVWTPDRYTTITLTYNPEMSKKLPGKSISSRFIQLIHSYSKWD
ncbi:MAG: hypothetical protein IJG34_08725 [Synergistaceae bacterium]|nr:hypothetical protein [Synergistaceae bacterium]MBQ3449961.1 hypothetical protein [Synergistaceae bacterium]MBQ3693573.1 hypothetical protein [Synergistaceae bacterium]MBQ6111137.1 hypothetical protein [Synergistaceae bacterium]MBQ9629896.1 hypothetical protein [Synergistaceae bacterium]